MKTNNMKRKNSKNKMILTEQEYCHVINKRNGQIRLVEGPVKLNLSFNLFEQIYGEIKNKIILEEGQFAIILNPFDWSRFF